MERKNGVIRITEKETNFKSYIYKKPNGKFTMFFNGNAFEIDNAQDGVCIYKEVMGYSDNDVIVEYNQKK